MPKIISHLYYAECKLIRHINQYFNQKYVNLFFRSITHLGGARFTIATIFVLIFVADYSFQYTAISSGIALSLSHIPVAIVKKIIPRKRPYLVLQHLQVTDSLLKDHSFPSGHTTAIFSIILPFILYQPMLAFILLPIGFAVGISRIYLGLHYPSDVVAGVLLGSLSGLLSYSLLGSLF